MGVCWPLAATPSITSRASDRDWGSGPTDGLLKLWDAKTGKLKQHLDGEHSSQVVDVAFSPDGKSLASPGTGRPAAASSFGIRKPAMSPK